LSAPVGKYTVAGSESIAYPFVAPATYSEVAVYVHRLGIGFVGRVTVMFTSEIEMKYVDPPPSPLYDPAMLLIRRYLPVAPHANATIPPYPAAAIPDVVTHSVFDRGTPDTLPT